MPLRSRQKKISTLGGTLLSKNSPTIDARHAEHPKILFLELASIARFSTPLLLWSLQSFPPDPPRLLTLLRPVNIPSSFPSPFDYQEPAPIPFEFLSHNAPKRKQKA
jgi:hypothetical protein